MANRSDKRAALEDLEAIRSAIRDAFPPIDSVRVALAYLETAAASLRGAISETEPSRERYPGSL